MPNGMPKSERLAIVEGSRLYENVLSINQPSSSVAGEAFRRFSGVWCQHQSCFFCAQ
jgi:hypothetical protein